MHMQPRIEAVLEDIIAGAQRSGPPRLGAALHYAVFPAGGRVRPELCLAVAQACGDPNPGVSNAAAASIELMHCGSLVHDDLPSFDDADTRRGKPSVHRMFGEELAVLVGDGLFIHAFQVLAERAAHTPHLIGPLVAALSRASGMPYGIVAGQSWESEETCDLDAYHSAKTGALFEAATVMGAISAEVDPEPWRLLGQRIGSVYQAADDIADALGDAATLGKPVGQDELLQRPSLVRRLGAEGALEHLAQLCEKAIQAIPPVKNREPLANLIRQLALRLCPQTLPARPHYTQEAVVNHL